jgi:hypothetical protein
MDQQRRFRSGDVGHYPDSDRNGGYPLRRSKSADAEMKEAAN